MKIQQSVADTRSRVDRDGQKCMLLILGVLFQAFS